MNKNLTSLLFLLSIFVSIFTLGLGCQSRSTDPILKVYVPEKKSGTILFDTKSKTGQVLIEDKTSVFFVMQTSKTQEWAVVSKMPSDPDEARGVNEEKLLFFIPEKRLVYNPDYGKASYLVAIDEDGNDEQVQWIVDGDKTVSFSLKELKERCLNDQHACSETGSSASSSSSETDTPDTQQQTTDNSRLFSFDNWLTLDLTQDLIISHVNEPEEKGEDEYWDATGTYVQQWHYTSQGLTIDMESDSLNGIKRVRGIKIFAPNNYKTPEAIGIGTDFATVKAAYADKLTPDEISEDLLIVGTSEGGMTFYFENGKVKQIYIGKAAE